MNLALLLVAAPLVTAASTEGDSIAIDGRLDEPAWSRAEPTGDFVERVPVEGAAPPAGTRFRVLYDEGALYFGVEMALLPGETPVSRELSRDSYRIWSDDAITIKLDVRGDRRHTQGFSINVAGAQIDFIALDNGKVFRREFDAVWTAAARVSDGAWIAELRLPVAALGAPAREGEQRMGLQVSRDHNARLATDDWAPMPAAFGPASAVHYGELRGVVGLGGGTPVSLQPYVLAEHPNRLAVGGDATLRVAEDLWLEATALTDFAQVDLDDPVVNLDRFPLFFPEKRPFFLSGAEVFEFGVGGVAQPFFSRRIGLDDAGAQIPIGGGAKLHGRAGGIGIGLLEVLTLGDDTRAAASHSVARARVDAGEHAHLGLIGTLTGELEGDFTPAYTVGADGSLALFEQRLAAHASWSATPSGGRFDDASAANVELSWRAEPFTPRLAAVYVEEAYDPALGFVRRPGIFEGTVNLPWLERTDALGLAQWSLSLAGVLTLDDSLDERLGVFTGFGAGAELRNGWSLQVGAAWAEDLVGEAFDLGPATVLPGRYQGASVNARVSRSDRRNPSGHLRYVASELYSGFAHTVAGNLAVAIGRTLRLTAGPSWSWIELAGADPFSTLSLATGLNLTPSTDIVADLVLLVNTLDEEATVMGRVRWRYLPGSDAFLVYREAIDLSGARAPTRTITLKVAFRYETVF